MPSPRQTVRMDAEGRIAEDCPCVQCRYNLRGLPPHGKCPECGFRVRPSVLARSQPGLARRGVRRIERNYFVWRLVRAAGLAVLSIILCVLICILSCRILFDPYF